MPTFGHGRQTVVKLDDLAGALQDVSAFFESAKYSKKTDRPNTAAFADVGQRRGVTGLKEATISLSGYLQQTAGVANRVHGRATKVLLDQYSLTGTFQKAAIKLKADRPDTAAFSDAWKRHAVLGLIDATVNLSGQFDSTATSGNSAVLSTLVDSDPPTFSVVDIAPNGFTIGNYSMMLSGVDNQLDIDSANTKVVDVSGALMSDGQFDLGVSLHDLTAETTTITGTAVDEAAATTNGGVGHLHVTSANVSSVTIKIQHSTDSTTWADLITFVAVTTTGSQRIELAAGSTVNRYVKAIISAFTGTTLTFAVTFGRRSFTTSGTYAAAGTARCLFGLLMATTSSTFEYAAQGTTAGLPRKTGECFLSDLSMDFSNTAVSKVQATLISDGAVTDNMY